MFQLRPHTFNSVSHGSLDFTPTFTSTMKFILTWIIYDIFTHNYSQKIERMTQ